MRKLVIIWSLVASLGIGANANAKVPAKGVQVVADEVHRRVDITIDGAAFTSYIWPTSLKKPVLFPLITDSGVTVTRGYPFDPRPNERTDHPHQVGMWFNYSNVNGFDFWNNSDAVKPERRSKMGTIVQSRVLSTQSGRNRGELVVESIWMTGDDKPLIKDTTRYIFFRRKRIRFIDQITTLQALDRVVFSDARDGLFGIRVAHWLESSQDDGKTLLDSSGRPLRREKPVAGDTTALTGVYRTGEGVSGETAWGTRSRWCTLTGRDADKHVVTLAVIDNPNNPGYPTYWHVRGYGLFAANPFGQNNFNPKLPPSEYAIEEGKTMTFRYRVILFSYAASPDEMNRETDRFQSEKE
jgi:hypothetical protein